MMKFFGSLLLATLALRASGHYVFSALKLGGTIGTEWTYTRMTNNHWSHGPVTDVTSADFRCYDSENLQNATTVSIAAGSSIGIYAEPNIFHPSVTNVYMAKAPSNISTWDGSGSVWFKIYQISAVTDGGTSITFPSDGLQTVDFTIPKSLPSGDYLLRIENVALHGASVFQGAQWYISCSQVTITGGGSGKPSPLVAFPGYYTGYEPGILIQIYWPIPTNYTQPGPAVWTG
ncbi:glycoside hydrolase [Flagelloscypha sp. PMI_526]|nr:glycoside hydrolase [Flagelloscypha sp. PMI_526]